MSTRALIPGSVPRKYRDTWPSCSSQTETPIASAGAETPAYRAVSVFRSCTCERPPVYRRHRGGVGGAVGGPILRATGVAGMCSWSARACQLVMFSGVVSMAGLTTALQPGCQVWFRSCGSERRPTQVAVSSRVSADAKSRFHSGGTSASSA